MGDALVALYYTPMDFVDLTKDDNEAAGEGPTEMTLELQNCNSMAKLYVK